jgi:hypothetical protein
MMPKLTAAPIFLFRVSQRSRLQIVRQRLLHQVCNVDRF